MAGTFWSGLIWNLYYLVIYFNYRYFYLVSLFTDHMTVLLNTTKINSTFLKKKMCCIEHSPSYKIPSCFLLWKGQCDGNLIQYSKTPPSCGQTSREEMLHPHKVLAFSSCKHRLKINFVKLKIYTYIYYTTIRLTHIVII